MARHDKIIQEYKEVLTKKGIENIPKFVQSILDADTTKGKYGRFLLDCFLADKFREEDLIGELDSTVGQAVTLFHKYKNKLPEDMRSIYKYSSPGGLWNAVKQFEGLLSGRELKREEQDRIYAETKFIYEDSEIGLKIVTPLTKESAQWWGRGTRWCTSANNGSLFEHYSQKAPLLIFLMPEGEKLQLWCHGDNIQFMDEADNEVTDEYINNHKNILEPFFVKNYILYYLDKKNLDDEYYLKAIEHDPLNYVYLPSHMLTKELINDIPDKVANDYHIMNSIVKHISFTKMDLETYKILDSKNSNTFNMLPDHSLSMQIINFALEKNGLNLHRVPKHMNNQKTCWKAICQNGKALEYVPIKWKTEDMCLEAFKNNAKCIEYIPEKNINEDMINECIKQGVPILEWLRNDIKTVKMCRDAVESNDSNVPYVINDKRLNDSIIQYAKNLNFSKECLRFIPSYYHNAVGMVMINENIDNFAKMPEDMRNDFLSQHVIEQDVSKFPLVPYYSQTQKMCDFVVKKDITLFLKTQKIYRTPDLSLYVLNKDITFMKHIPNSTKEKLTTEQYHDEFYNILVKNINSDTQNLRYVPKEAYHDNKFISFLEKITNEKLKNHLVQRFEATNLIANKVTI